MAKGKQGGFFSSIFSAVLAVLVLLSVRWALVEPFVIPSGSMIPTLLVHDHILVNKSAFGIRKPFTKEWLIWFDRPKRGEIVVFRSVESDNHFMIKRVIGVPGDRVSILADGTVVVNDEPFKKEALPDPTDGGRYYAATEDDIEGEFKQFQFFKEWSGDVEHRIMLRGDALRMDWEEEPFVVPDGHLFLMGDNRDNSRDSRSWGMLPMENLLGRATNIWLSCHNKLEFMPFLCNPLQLRWRRLFHGIN